MLVSDIVRRNAMFFGDRDAVVVPGVETRSWADLDLRTNRFARALAELGVAKGARLATYAPNCSEYIDFFFACAKSGVIGNTTNVRLAGDEIAAYLRYTEPEAILVHADLAAAASSFLADVPSLRHVIGIGDGHGFALDLEDLIAGERSDDPGMNIDETDVYQLGATSGTTGTPKGAVLTHRNAIAAISCWLAELPIAEGDTNLQNIPLFFNPGGPAGLHPVLIKGGRTVIFPRFEPGEFLRAVPEYQATHSVLVPTMVGMVLAHPECGSHDLTTLRGVISGGSPLPRPVLARAREVFGDVFYPLYGLAESYSCGLVLRPECQFTEGPPEVVARLASAGKPNVLMQARVVGDDGQDVLRDAQTPGEIWLRGDTISEGYFGLPEETAASREGDWFRTADLATVDREGFVTIVDRMKDVIITGGINVFSRDVEEVLYAHPAVLQVAVIGIPDENWGETIHAVVVAKPDTDTDGDALLRFAAERLAAFKKPRSIEFVEALPIGGTGKILKRELRARYWVGRERMV